MVLPGERKHKHEDIFNEKDSGHATEFAITNLCLHNFSFNDKSAKSKYWLILSQSTVEQRGLKPLTGVPHSGWGVSLRSKSNKYWKPPLGHSDLKLRIPF